MWLIIGGVGIGGITGTGAAVLPADGFLMGKLQGQGRGGRVVSAAAATQLETLQNRRMQS